MKKTASKTKSRAKEPKKPEIPVVDVYSLSGKKIDKFKLNPDVFNARIHGPLLHQVLVMYSANQRQAISSTKTRAEVRGGGKKPWRQKGTGRARAGSIRSPLWRGGGVTFGPKPRDYGYSLPQKMKKIALMSSLSVKTKDNEIMVLEKDPELTQPKTKEMAKVLLALKTHNKKVLFVCSKRDKNLMLSCRNIKNLCLKLYDDFNSYDVLSNSKVLFSRDTHDHIVKRLSKSK